MMKKIGFVARIIIIGSSIGFTIPKNIKDVLDLKKGDFVITSLEKASLSKEKPIKRTPEELRELRQQQLKEKMESVRKFQNEFEAKRKKS